MDIAAPTPFAGQRPQSSTQASHSPPPDSRQAAATTSRVSLCCTGFCRHRPHLLVPCRPPRPVYHTQASASSLRGHLHGGTLSASITACTRWPCLAGLRCPLHAPPVPRQPPSPLARTAALHRSDVRASYPAAISFLATTCCLQ
ncbi:Os10g0162860 [Oryza sativa Japonica Group]|uniref:Os10g0162860 protein n=1 Tax=Oryza sativa subsp. japonica TaxID=39947 RepID=A0A0N7KRH2_ORYSJ|nr:Os10g0162860 [Oryza sativa Japonica Group]